jgi:hypothetical protein
MSFTVEYFFNSDDDLKVVAPAINRVLGCSLARYEGDPEDLYCRFCSMELTLRVDHGLVNDREMNFQDYRVVLDAQTPVPDSDLRPVQVEVMVLAAFLLHRRLAIHSGMLTFDVQRLLARYELVGDRWFDQVSGKPVRIPEHLLDVRTRPSDRGLYEV